jgi:hypothetical protein
VTELMRDAVSFMDTRVDLPVDVSVPGMLEPRFLGNRTAETSVRVLLA